MLQQILKDMYIDPDVLNALNEDQKKTLFLKMRQEQVRRWKEREEKLEREGGDAECRRTKPKKANSKNVSWLLGRDGDVAVIVIGEVDELTSKFICAGFGDKKPPSLQNNANHQTILKSRKPSEPVRTEREDVSPKTQPGISLSLKQGERDDTSTLHHLPVSVSEHSSPPVGEKPESKSAGAVEEPSAPQPSICSGPPARASPFNLRPASASTAPGSLNVGPGLPDPKPAAAAPSAPQRGPVKADSGATSAAKAVLPAQAPQKPQELQGERAFHSDLHQGSELKNSGRTGEPEAKPRAAQKEAGSLEKAPTCAGRGRVAQLMKTFSPESTAAAAAGAAPRGVKPPLPSKPSHLRLTTTPTVR